MNQKIQDLMYHAGLTAQGCWDSMDQYDQEAITKFAELLVKECADLRIDYGTDDYYNGWLDYREEIKRHFGVD